jgi:hypothetical protein
MYISISTPLFLKKSLFRFGLAINFFPELRWLALEFNSHELRSVELRLPVVKWYQRR